MGEVTIWTEKYRPKEFSDVRGQDEIVEKIAALTKEKNLPHLMFTGPAGTGKTSLSLVIAKQLFKDAWHANLLELNASDERGIDIIRHKVKDFARTKAIGDVPFKIIYLDECDALTKEAQQALRRPMENYTQTCRFILSANSSSKIIDPIQSRCAVFRFKPLSKEHLSSIIDGIVRTEHLSADKGAKDALVEVSGGDCRRMENILQSCSALSKNITEELVFSMASVAKPKEVKKFLELALQDRFQEARKVMLDVMLQYGLSGLDMIKQIQKEILTLDADGRKRMQLMAECGEAEFRLSEGSDEYVQLEAFLAKVVLAGAEK